MRLSAFAALAVVGFIQTGCDRAAKPASEPAKPAETAAAPLIAPGPATGPAVVVPSGKFDAISNTAMGVTGDLRAEGGVFTFAQGQTYSLEGAGAAKAGDPYAVTKASLGSLINVPGTADLKVLRVTKEDPAKARNGGFCGADPTTFIVSYEGGDSSGASAMVLIAFKGPNPPSARSPEADLCGTFMYAPSTGQGATK
ncbi:hypothetical protein [Phenylobacterium sp. Root700]|uniref:hypothetical protein n=1 Tax=Phenylobacterium sp. Root700 TaxID=1736591 RepID=UPI0006F7102F|nr:hypothetical protein [Phenylobacterium sp. Root700]KRB44585.1 hypothetical protein ASE02_02830 [Phenylobacterium sp. Root700]